MKHQEDWEYLSQKQTCCALYRVFAQRWEVKLNLSHFPAAQPRWTLDLMLHLIASSWTLKSQAQAKHYASEIQLRLIFLLVVQILFQTLKSVWGWFIHSYVKMLTGAKFKNHNGAKRPADRRPQREGVFPGSWGQCRSYFKKTLFCFSVCD